MSASNSKRAVLFGGAGFIGSHLAVSLSQDGWQTTIITKHPHRHRELLVIPSLKFIAAGDLSDEFIASQIHASDTVVNLIGILNQNRSATFADLHVRLPQRIAETCLRNQARRLISISALGGAVDAPSQYLQSRGQGERELQTVMQNGLNCTIIRPSIVFGPGDSFSRMFHQLLSISPLIFPLIMPDAVIQPVYVKDVVRCIVHAMNVRTPDRGSFDVAGPDVFSLREFIALIDRMAGMRHRIVGLNQALSRLLASIAQYAPGRPLTPDNILSLQVPNSLTADVPPPYGAQSTKFESVANTWLGGQNTQYDRFRTQAGR